MSIFDRLISTLTGSTDTRTAVPPPARPAAQEEATPGRRFMGRDGAQVPTAVVEQGLAERTGTVWLHLQPATQRLLLVERLGMAQGEPLNATMTADVERLGWCDTVVYHAGADQYWKMPQQDAILRTPGLFRIPTPAHHEIHVETRLVKQGEPRGFWMGVRMRTVAELAAQPQLDAQV